MSLATLLTARRADVVPLTSALVRAASPNPPGDEEAAAAVLAEYLDGLAGVQAQYVRTGERRTTVVFAAGEGGPTLALSAHLDTHPVDGAWTRDPFEPSIEGDHLYGLGSTDIKGGAAAMAAVFRAFAERPADRGSGRLLLVANADEETGGEFGIAVVRDSLRERPDAVVVAEPSGIDSGFERLYVAARGTSRFRLSVAGVETHSSLADHDGVSNGLERLETVVTAVRSSLSAVFAGRRVHGLAPRLVPVRLEGGVGWGVVPARAAVDLELRVTPGIDQADAERCVEAAVTEAARLAEAPVELEYAPGSLRWMAPSHVATQEPIVVAAQAAWREVLGEEPVLGCFPGGTDARLWAERGIPTLAGVGPGALLRAHKADEYVTLTELDAAVALYAAIVDRYFAPRGA